MIFLRQFENRIHVRHLPVKMDWNDGRYRTPAALADKPAVFRSAAALEVGAQFQRIHVVGALVNIDELGECARLRDSFGGRDERVRNGYHGVARLDAGGGQRETERVRAAVDCYGAAGLAEG